MIKTCTKCGATGDIVLIKFQNTITNETHNLGCEVCTPMKNFDRDNPSLNNDTVEWFKDEISKIVHPPN